MKRRPDLIPWQEPRPRLSWWPEAVMLAVIVVGLAFIAAVSWGWL